MEGGGGGATHGPQYFSFFLKLVFFIFIFDNYEETSPAPMESKLKR